VPYVLRGRLCGFICAECPEPLSAVSVRLYRSRTDQNVTALAVASPKETFRVLTDQEVNAKSLLAEATTDAAGNFTIEIDERRQGYGGEAFEIDIYCGTVPHRKPTPQPPQPRQFTVTTLQPSWRQTEGGFVAAWDYCIPQRLWCFIRSLFGAWTICGRVTLCDTGSPIGGLRVRGVRCRLAAGRRTGLGRHGRHRALSDRLHDCRLPKDDFLAEHQYRTDRRAGSLFPGRNIGRHGFAGRAAVARAAA
jgi:hypothetical protein